MGHTVPNLQLTNHAALVIMLTPIGRVTAILNDKMILIESSKTLARNEVLVAFQRVPLPDNPSGLGEIDVPKGEIAVVLRQEKDTYLAERYKERHVRWTTGAEEMLSLIGQGKRRIEEGEWSAQFDRAKSLGINVSETIRLDDLVARLPDDEVES